MKIDQTLKGGDITKVLDRFQTPYNKQSVESLRGGFASPVFLSKYQTTEIPLPFTYESRALLTGVEENLVYINFRLKPSADVSVKVGPSMPWGTSKGNAIQYKLNKNLSDLDLDDYEIIEKLIFKRGKWRKTPIGFEDYGKKVDGILEKIICP